MTKKAENIKNKILAKFKLYDDEAFSFGTKKKVVQDIQTMVDQMMLLDLISVKDFQELSDVINANDDWIFN